MLTGINAEPANSIAAIYNRYGVVPQGIRCFFTSGATPSMPSRTGIYSNVAASVTFITLPSQTVINGMIALMGPNDRLDLYHEADHDFTIGSTTHIKWINDTLQLQTWMAAKGVGNQQVVTFTGGSFYNSNSYAKSMWEIPAGTAADGQFHTLRGSGIQIIGADYDGNYWNPSLVNQGGPDSAGNAGGYTDYNGTTTPYIQSFMTWAGISRWCVNESNVRRCLSDGSTARDADGHVQTPWLIKTRADALAAGCEQYYYFEYDDAYGRQYMPYTLPYLAPLIDINSTVTPPAGGAGVNTYVTDGKIENSTASATIAVPIPASAVANDRVIIAIAAQETTPSWTVDTGFTIMPLATAASRTNMSVVVCSKKINSTDVGGTVTATFTTTKLRTAIVMVLRGTDDGNDGATGDGVGWTTPSTAGVAPSITTTKNHDTILSIFAIQANTNSPLTTWTTPTGLAAGPTAQALVTASTAIAGFYQIDQSTSSTVLTISNPDANTSVYSGTAVTVSGDNLTYTVDDPSIVISNDGLTFVPTIGAGATGSISTTVSRGSNGVGLTIAIPTVPSSNPVLTASTSVYTSNSMALGFTFNASSAAAVTTGNSISLSSTPRVAVAIATTTRNTITASATAVVTNTAAISMAGTNVVQIGSVVVHPSAISTAGTNVVQIGVLDQDNGFINTSGTNAITVAASSSSGTVVSLIGLNTLIVTPKITDLVLASLTGKNTLVLSVASSTISVSLQGRNILTVIPGLGTNPLLAGTTYLNDVVLLGYWDGTNLIPCVLVGRGV